MKTLRMIHWKKFMILALLAACTALLPACKEGTGEEIGEELDKAGENTRDAVKDATN